MATNRDIQRRIAEFARQLCEELGEVQESDGDCWLDAVENRAVEVGDAVSAALMARQSAQQKSLDGEAACPQCGEMGRYRGDRERELLTRRGPAMIAEPEYFCPCCRKAFFPDDGRDRR
jgi:hypothetical protein